MLNLVSMIIIMWSAIGFLMVVNLDDETMSQIGNYSIHKKIKILIVSGPLVWFMVLFVLLLIERD